MTESTRSSDSTAGPARRLSAMPPLAITIEAQDGMVLMRVAGEIDLATSEQWRASLGSVVADAVAQHLIVDLSDVSFISSEGIGTLVTTQQRLAEQGGRLEVVASDRTVVRAIELLGLAALFNLRPRLSDS